MTPCPSSSVLSEREQEVVRLIGDGLSAKEIAARLYLSVKTVETHRANIHRKVFGEDHVWRGTRGGNAALLMRWAITVGIVQTLDVIQGPS